MSCALRQNLTSIRTTQTHVKTKESISLYLFSAVQQRIHFWLQQNLTASLHHCCCCSCCCCRVFLYLLWFWRESVVLIDVKSFLYYRWFSFISMMVLLIYKYEPFWQEVSVKILTRLLWPVGHCVLIYCCATRYSPTYLPVLLPDPVSFCFASNTCRRKNCQIG